VSCRGHRGRKEPRLHSGGAGRWAAREETLLPFVRRNSTGTDPHLTTSPRSATPVRMWCVVQPASCAHGLLVRRTSKGTGG
jgi:hypothetical protein